MSDIILPEILASLQAYASSTGMMDRCIIVRRTPLGEDDLGNETSAYVPDATQTLCRFRSMTPREVEVDGQVELIESVFHLPLSCNIKKSDRVQLVKKWDNPSTVPLTFDIVGDPKPGALEFTVRCKRSTNKVQ